MDVAAFLRGSPLTAAVSDDARADLAGRLTTHTVASGDVLLRQGEAGDALYLVVVGRLVGLVEDDDGPHVVARLSNGDVVGELAVLADSPRLATVVAVRDTTLLRLSREDFEQVVAHHPDVLRAVGSTVVRRIGERGAPPAPPSTTVAVVSAGDPAAGDVFASALAEHLRAHGDVATLQLEDTDDLNDAGRRLLAGEERSRFVVLTGTAATTSWVLRHADCVLVVTRYADAQIGPPVMAALDDLAQQPATAPDVHLVVLPRPGDAPRALPARGRHELFGNVFTVRDDDASRLARFVAGRSVGIALGGGGARGFAHLGVLRALDEAGIAIDVVAGSSMGALFGAMYAIGWEADEREQRAKDALSGSRPLFAISLPVLLPAAASRLQRELADDRVLGTRRIEDLAIPFCCLSADLGRAETVVHDRGLLAEAVRASISLPGVLPPVTAGDRWLVDGGVLDNLPVTAVRARNRGGPVIAVDIRPQVDPSLIPGYSDAHPGRSRGRKARRPENFPSLLDVLVRSNMLGSVRAQQDVLEKAPVDLLLRPPVQSVRILDFRRGAELIDGAYRDTQAALEATEAKL